jgi:hypothetical protein
MVSYYSQNIINYENFSRRRCQNGACNFFTLIYEHLENIKCRRILEMKDLKDELKTIKKGRCSFAMGK